MQKPNQSLRGRAVGRQVGHETAHRRKAYLKGLSHQVGPDRDQTRSVFPFLFIVPQDLNQVSSCNRPQGGWPGAF